MEELHHRLIRIGLDALAADFGYALAGGYAIQAHHIVQRLSDDVDLFAPIDRRSEMPAATDRIVGAYEQAGFEVERGHCSETYVRLQVTDLESGATSKVGEAADRIRAAVRPAGEGACGARVRYQPVHGGQRRTTSPPPAPTRAATLHLDGTGGSTAAARRLIEDFLGELRRVETGGRTRQWVPCGPVLVRHTLSSYPDRAALFLDAAMRRPIGGRRIAYTAVSVRRLLPAVPAAAAAGAAEYEAQRPYDQHDDGDPPQNMNREPGAAQDQGQQ